MPKPNCYECQYRGNVPGDAHSCCRHPEVKDADSNLFGALVQLLHGEFTDAIRKLKIQGNEHGIRSGWFMWPANFDPTWLENCDGFKQKEVPSGRPSEQHPVIE